MRGVSGTFTILQKPAFGSLKIIEAREISSSGKQPSSLLCKEVAPQGTWIGEERGQTRTRADGGVPKKVRSGYVSLDQFEQVPQTITPHPSLVGQFILVCPARASTCKGELSDWEIGLKSISTCVFADICYLLCSWGRGESSHSLHPTTRKSPDREQSPLV